MRFVFLIVASILTSSCGHFQGPGSLVAGGAYTTPDQYPRNNDVPKVIVPHTPGPFTLRWPVNNVRITQEFSPYKNRKHQGVDFGGKRGTPIFAAHEGMVVYAGRDFRGYGKMVLIEYNSEWASLYAHLDKIIVKEGQVVEPGQTVGTMGRTGRASGVHLHFELIRFKQTVDPIPLLNRLPRVSATSESPFRKHIVYKRGETPPLETLSE